jgi:uncharacterized protein
MFRFSARPNRAHLIDWHDWNEETFKLAEEQEKPIFLLLVAYWCGSCQRLDETAFSNDDVIDLLNASYIPIRVEESQRPDIDLRYTQNGWPTLSILTSTGEHLFSLPALGPKPLTDILSQTATNYRTKRSELLSRATVVDGNDATVANPTQLKPTLVGEIAWMLQGLTDSEHGGYGIESKFPNASANDFFLYLYETIGERQYLDYVLLTLRKMLGSAMLHREGGGGFYRYSSKPDWTQPHPEKLLDDQATLLSNYLHAYLLTDELLYRETAESLIAYMDETLLDPASGVFFGCQDYIRRFNGFGQADSPLDSYLDECLYCDQNARAASAYLQAWWLLGRQDCRERAEHILNWIWENLRNPDGGMYHFSYRDDRQTPGMLLDVTALGTALLDAYAYTEEPEHMRRALELGADIIRRHRSDSGGFFDIDHTGPGGLRTRIASPVQNAGVAAFFIRLADLSGQNAYRDGAYWALWSFDKPHERYGVLTASFGEALARYMASPVSATIVGVPGDGRVRELARAAVTQLRQPDIVLRFAEDDGSNDAWIEVTTPAGVSQSLYEPELLTPALLAIET